MTLIVPKADNSVPILEGHHLLLLLFKKGKLKMVGMSPVNLALLPRSTFIHLRSSFLGGIGAFDVEEHVLLSCRCRT